VSVAKERRVSANIITRSDNPDKFLARMVVAKLDTERIVVDSLFSSEL
jgi:hypothetical protein